jgi:hypothetical protein
MRFFLFLAIILGFSIITYRYLSNGVCQSENRVSDIGFRYKNVDVEENIKSVVNTDNKFTFKREEIQESNRISQNIVKKVISTSSGIKDRKTQLENYFLKIKTLDNPQEKRLFRRLIAQQEPKSLTLRYVTNQYNSTNDPELKLHLQSIITQIDASTILEEVSKLAHSTDDDALFVSLVYSLKKADKQEAKKLMLDLLVNNQFEMNENNQNSSNQWLNSISIAFQDSITKEDFSWLYEYVDDQNIQDRQLHIIVNSVKKYSTVEANNLLVLTQRKALSTNLQNKINRILEEKEIAKANERL